MVDELRLNVANQL
jgi:Ca2+-dependent lipid-binding protein